MLNIKRNPMLYTLSKKYQLEENLKVMGNLRQIGFIVYIIVIVFTIIAIIIPWDKFLIIDLELKDLLFFHDIFLTSGVLLFPIAALLMLYKSKNPAFLRKIQWLFRLTANKRIDIKCVKPINLQNETNIYFDQLQNSWK
ncbi:unnamed protein product [Caenorhabditis angaria]|uniref:Uncharacterized protein n=1 Tax=Caenorhabditis angaria TaxID=860376 RepID=A0A9P1IEH0_9PELO|nr:unnamed protein product [Caenorhabditis angaria]